MSMTKDRAETIGLQCLEWLVGNDELLPVFLGATGASAQDLRDGADQPDFWGAVLDFLLMDDNFVRDFCTAQNLSPEWPYMARQMLPGGDIPNWT
ncbi:hypothetical protein GCM10008927_20350 [Amylibacter ulvae]|uniref:DUF3572 domain-containing protein n=1 Tax=Paramylibacter ulvae TaxID=1651968 RepID=A0ABQ3D3B7_9RHOB|nr:DUF3572 domain-containing protein [Amylibacter ulvae]GHA54486.1 hypothetical protein GCM10008927_20350 [Amylibacter ulvae]